MEGKTYLFQLFNVICALSLLQLAASASFSPGSIAHSSFDAYYPPPTVDFFNGASLVSVEGKRSLSENPSPTLATRPATASTETNTSTLTATTTIEPGAYTASAIKLAASNDTVDIITLDLPCTEARRDAQVAAAVSEARQRGTVGTCKASPNPTRAVYVQNVSTYALTKFSVPFTNEMGQAGTTLYRSSVSDAATDLELRVPGVIIFSAANQTQMLVLAVIVLSSKGGSNDSGQKKRRRRWREAHVMWTPAAPGIPVEEWVILTRIGV